MSQQTDDFLLQTPQTPKKPSAFAKTVKKIILVLGLGILIIFAYLFLLLGEPEEDTKYAASTDQSTILTPINALETQGDHLETMAEIFEEPILVLHGNAKIRKARAQDTAFRGGYARQITLTYELEDGTTFTVDSLRPAEAISLLDTDSALLDGKTLYSIGGLNAARIDKKGKMCVFAQNDDAIYCVTAPQDHAKEIETLLRQTSLLAGGDD